MVEASHDEAETSVDEWLLMFRRFVGEGDVSCDPVVGAWQKIVVEENGRGAS